MAEHALFGLEKHKEMRLSIDNLGFGDQKLMKMKGLTCKTRARIQYFWYNDLDNLRYDQFNTLFIAFGLPDIYR